MNKNHSFGKGLAVLVVILFVGINAVPSNAESIVNNSSTSFDGKTLYVGGSGPGNYSTIQDAIDNASYHDTIFVYNGTYYEQLWIDLPIQLIGESKNDTIINSKTSNTAFILLDWNQITISGFTLNDDLDAGWILRGQDPLRNINIIDNNIKTYKSPVIVFHGFKDVVIKDNIISATNRSVIDLKGGVNCTIVNNFFSNCSLQVSSGPFNISNNRITGGSIYIYSMSNSLVTWNILQNTMYHAIYVQGGSNNTFGFNIISNHLDPLAEYNSFGIFLFETQKTTITKNYISGNTFGVYLWDSRMTFVCKNTFIDNNVHALFYNTHFHFNKWSRNYWGRPRLLPKAILGLREGQFDLYFYPGFLSFDWRPAIKPYDIPRIK